MKFLDVAVFAYFFLFIIGVLIFQMAIRKLPQDERNQYLQFRIKQRKWYPLIILIAGVGFIAMKFFGTHYFKEFLSIATIIVIALFAYLHKLQNKFFKEFNFPKQFESLMSINFLVDLLRQIAFIIILFFVLKDFML